MGDQVSGTDGTAQGAFPGMPLPLYSASPSRLLAWLDCPRRYRMQYLDRPRPATRPPRAHTSVGVATHHALRDWWDLPDEVRTAAAGPELVRTSWIDVGFRDPDQSATWLATVQAEVTAYLGGLDPRHPPVGLERTVAFRTRTIALTGRVDRLDDRGGELVVVDYKTSRRASTTDEARTSLPMALYAAAVWKMFRRRCVRVELHHVPTGTVAAHTHTDESLTRKVAEAESIARDARAADAQFREIGVASSLFPPHVSSLCAWCDYRAHCPEGQQVGPERSGWAALERAEASGASLASGDTS
ncbi:RecB family exonuclease [Lapillicoccus sp.]|uniref:RecB family exonuclease n=1 Tax=Lapillicoccus sp. TaxID=1909287 RepID=UPI003982E49B